MLLNVPVAPYQTVGNWIKQDGFLLVFGSVMMGFIIAFGTTWLMAYKHKVNCQCQDRHKAPDLLSHPYFGTMELYLKTKVLTLCLPEKGREAIFRDFLKYKFNVFITNVYTWLVKNVGHLDDMSSESLYNEMLILVASSISEYENMALSSGIPEIVLEKFRKFHSEHVDSVTTGVYNICQCEWIVASNTEKVGFILNSLMNTFDATLVDAEVVLCDINGELDGIVYKGIEVQPFKKTMKKVMSSKF